MTTNKFNRQYLTSKPYPANYLHIHHQVINVHRLDHTIYRTENITLSAIMLKENTYGGK